MCGGGINVWACYSYFGLMNAAMYVDILQNGMHKYAEYEMPLRWPAQSPDLNPIENLWSHIKEAVKIASPKNDTELWSSVKAAVEAILIAKCHSLVDSMQNRCKVVIFFSFAPF